MNDCEPANENRLAQQRDQLMNMAMTPEAEMPVHDGPDMEDDELMDWIRIELASRTKTIDPEALNSLSNDIGRLAHEIARYE